MLASADVLRRLGGDVTVRLYPGLGHEVNEDELEHVRGLMQALVAEEEEQEIQPEG